MSEKVLNGPRVSELWARVKAYAAEQGGIGRVPVGGIIIWSGAADAVPEGWALCDGTNGTPDLRGRFVLGASSTHGVGTAGGSEEVALTVAQMPEHTHGTKCIGYNGVYVPQASSGNTAASFAWRLFDTDPAGGGEPHNNMPPYYVLAYIMKL